MPKYETPAEVPANPNLVEFPTDIDGIFSKLQKEGLLASQRVYCQEQFDLCIATYSILIKHTQALWARTKADNEAHVAAHLAHVEQLKLDELAEPVAPETGLSK